MQPTRNPRFSTRCRVNSEKLTSALPYATSARQNDVFPWENHTPARRPPSPLLTAENTDADASSSREWLVFADLLSGFSGIRHPFNGAIDRLLFAATFERRKKTGAKVNDFSTRRSYRLRPAPWRHVPRIAWRSASAVPIWPTLKLSTRNLSTFGES